MDKNWNLIPIKPKSKEPALPKNHPYLHKPYPKENLKNHKGNLAVVCGETSGNLIIIDLDYKDDNKKHFVEIFSKFHEKYPRLSETYIEETPHGHHIFYNIKGKCPTRSPRQDSKKKNIIDFLEKGKNPNLIKVTNFPKLLKGVDILGTNGYSVIYPSKGYKQMNKLPIKTISVPVFNKIKSFFLREKTEKKRLRDPFYQILIGKIDIEELSQLTGEKEFIYWKYTFIEAYHQLELLPEDIIPFLEKNQSAFDIEKTQTQLQYINLEDPPLTNEKMEVYFPNFKKRTSSNSIIEKVPEYIQIADYLVEKYNLVTMEDTEQLMTRKGNVYSTDLTNFYYDLAKEIEMTGKTISYLSSNILKRIKYTTLFNRNKFNFEDWVINFANGYYDIKTETFYPNDEHKDKLFCYEIPHEFEPNEKYDCPKFKSALKDWLGEENKISPDDMFEMMGYTMTMNTDLKVAFFIFGPSHAGKTQFQTILEHIIGHQNRINIPLQRLCKNEFGTEGAEFKTLDMVGDISPVSADDVATFKEFTGGDKYMRAELKGGRKYQFRNICKIWYNGNRIPELKTDDNAFYNRWILIQFPNIFEMFDDNTVKNFGDRLCEDQNEINGIIHECIKGVKRLYERQYFRKEIMINTKHIWKYYAEPIYAYISDYYMFDRDGETPCKDFKEGLNEFLYKRGEKWLTSQKINAKLESYGIYQKRIGINDSREYIYKGIRKKKGIENYQINFGEKK